MERIVIVAYRPLPGKDEALETMAKSHWSKLDELGLVSPRKPILSKSEDGSIIEVFGWKSAKAIEQAHANPAIQELWEAFAQACEFIPVGDVKEAGELFSEFTPL